MQPTNDSLQKVRPPAIALILVGSMNGGLALMILVSGLLRLMNVIDTGPGPMSGTERTGYLVGTFTGYAVGFICLLLAPVIIFGGIRMMKGANYGLARAAAVLAILPFTSCCFLAGIPIGIWALVVLAKPEVKSLFGRG